MSENALSEAERMLESDWKNVTHGANDLSRGFRCSDPSSAEQRV